MYVGLGSNVLDPPHQSDNVDKCIQGDGIERARPIINVLKETIYCIRNNRTGSLKESNKYRLDHSTPKKFQVKITNHLEVLGGDNLVLDCTVLLQNLNKSFKF